MKAKLTNRIFTILIILATLFLLSCDEFNPLTAAGSGELKIYWVSSNGVTGPTIQSSNLDGSEKEDLSQTADFSKVVIDKTNERLVLVHVTSTNQLWYTDLDVPGTISPLTSQVGDAFHDIALDPLGGKIYFINESLGTCTIQRVNLDGSGVEDVTPAGYVGVSAGRQAIDIDPFAGKMYYIDDVGPDYGVRRANLDGSADETLITYVNPIGDVAVDPWNSKIYWNSDKLFVSSYGAPNNPTELLGYSVVDLAVDPFQDCLYFTYNDIGDQEIGRIAAGMSTYDRIVTGLTSPAGIFLDLWP